MTTNPRFLFVQTYYPDFLNGLYASEPAQQAGSPGLASLDYQRQWDRIFSTWFSIGDAYSHYLRSLGCEAYEVIANADVMQRQWAKEHDLALSGNIHDQRRRVVAAQIGHYRPDVVYVFEWCPLGDRFLAEIRRGVRLVVGQISSSLPADRTFDAYDVIVSSWPSIVELFQREGARGAYLRLGFDPRVLEHLGKGQKDIDVSFVGGFAPVHDDRIAWLEHLLGEFDVAVFGYGAERLPADSPIRRAHHGPLWGLDMYRAIQRSRVTLNRHARIDVRGTVSQSHAANMRLFESTGVGTCLLTEEKADLAGMFEPGRDVMTYADYHDCVDKLRHLLENEAKRRSVAEAGHRRTMRDHTYADRMSELLDLVRTRL